MLVCVHVSDGFTCCVCWLCVRVGVCVLVMCFYVGVFLCWCCVVRWWCVCMLVLCLHVGVLCVGGVCASWGVGGGCVLVVCVFVVVVFIVFWSFGHLTSD